MFKRAEGRSVFKVCGEVKPLFLTISLSVSFFCEAENLWGDSGNPLPLRFGEKSNPEGIGALARYVSNSQKDGIKYWLDNAKQYHS